MDLEDIKKQLDTNTTNIQNNLEKIETNLSKINENAEKIQKNTLALEILSDYKKDKKILICILIAVIILWITTLIVFHM